MCYFKKKIKNPPNLNWTGDKTIYVLFLLFNFFVMSIFDEKILILSEFKNKKLFF